MPNLERIKEKESLITGGSLITEGSNDLFSSGSNDPFSLKGKVVFTIGRVENGGNADTLDELYMQYAYGLDLNKNFSGEDLLSVGIKTGNASGPLAAMDSAVENNSVSIDNAFYEFPVLNNVSVKVGPVVSQSDLFSSISYYSDNYRLTSAPYTEAAVETGVGASINWENKNFSATIGLLSTEGDNATEGIGADNSADITSYQLTWSFGSYGSIGIKGASNDCNNTGYDTLAVAANLNISDADVTVVLDTKNPVIGSDLYNLFVGGSYAVGPGIANAAYSWEQNEDNSNLNNGNYEIYYYYSSDDGIGLRVGGFNIEDTGTGDDDSGVVLETTFKF